MFRPGSLSPQRDTLAITGRADQVVASTSAGTLQFRERRNGLAWSIPDDAPITPAGEELQRLAAAGIQVYGRPIVDDDLAQFVEDGPVRTYTYAPIRALLMKPILAEASRAGWLGILFGLEADEEGEEDDMERRFVEFRAEANGISGTVLRYGDIAKFGRFTERFEPASIRMDADIIANIMHERSRPVARIGAGLVLNDDGRSIEARIEWPETVYAREAKELVEARILRGFSIEFIAEEERMVDTQRVITKARMSGFGIVDRPAYSESQIADRMEHLAGIHDLPAPVKRRLR